MRKKIVLSFLALFAFFTSGTLITAVYITKTTSTLNRLITLHKIELLREELVINIQTVQSDFYTVRTPLAEDLSSIIQNVTNLDEAARKCNSCHHVAEISTRLEEILRLVDDYKGALSYYITARANAERTQKLKSEAAAVGNNILNYTQEMVFAASKKLEERTQRALEDVDNARIILFFTLVCVLMFALWVSISLTKSIIGPVNELVAATRKIASGELGHTISYSDKTELGELAEKFNAMSVELKDVYEKIRESEWRFRTLSEFAFDWEYWINEEREIVYMSPSCERITGYKQEDFVRNPGLLTDIIHADERDEYGKHISDFNAPGHQETEFRIATKNGSEKWLSHVCGPILIENKFLGRRITNRDITDRKRLEEQLAQSQKMESLGLLSGGVAHDFSNLLTAISGYCFLLEAELGNADDKAKRYLSNMLNAFNRAQGLASNLLVFSRKQIVKPHKINLDEVVRNISKLLQRVIGEDIELKTRCSKDEFAVFADPHQLEQIMMNLATNARDAMPSGGTLTIKTTPMAIESGASAYGISKPGRYMILTVSDTGIGMDKEEIARIFEPFYTTKAQGKGTGLGLSMVHGMANENGWFIDVESSKGVGTAFRLIMPSFDEIDVVQDQDADISEPVADLRGDEVILVAEDEQSVREFLNDALTSYGYEIMMAVDGEDAVKKYIDNRERIDMVVLDVIMPKMGGRQAYDRLKELDPDVKVLFMTGYAPERAMSKGITGEGLELMHKPLNITALLRKIRQILMA